MVELQKVMVIGGWDGDLPSDEELKDFDIVVRLNNHWLRQGGRLDVLYHCASSKCPFLHLVTNHDFRNQVKEIRGAGWSSEWPNIEKFCKAHEIRCFPFQSNEDPYRELSLILQTKGGSTPLTGLIAIKKYLDDGHEVHTRGMNLYRDWEGKDTHVSPTITKEMQIKAHNPAAHAFVIAEMDLCYSKLFLSDALKEVVEYWTEV